MTQKESDQLAQLQAELAGLRQENQRLAQQKPQMLLDILDNCVDVVTAADLQQKVIYLNQQGQDILGWPEGQYQKRNIADAHPPWAASIVLEHGVPTSLRKGIWQGETALLTADGKELPVSQIIVAHTSKSGELQWLSSIMRDISETKEIQQAHLLQHELSLALSGTTGLQQSVQLIVDQAVQIGDFDSGGVYIVDDETGALNLIYSQGLSPAFVEQTRYFPAQSKQAQLIYRGEPIFLDYTTSELAQTHAKRQEKLMATAILPVRHQSTIIGALNIASHTSSEISQTAQQAILTIANMVGSAIARVSVEAKIQASETKFRNVIQNFQDGFCLVDENGFIVEWNRSLEKITGIPKEQVYGRISTDIIYSLAPEHLRTPELKTNLQNIVSQFKTQKAIPDNPDPNTMAIVRPDGEVRTIQVSEHVIQAEGHVWISSTIRDITQQIKTQIEMEQLRHYLTNIVDSMPSVLVAVDASGRITQWNKQAQQETGLTSEQAQGLAFGEVFPRLLAKRPEIVQSLANMQQQKLEKIDMGAGETSRYLDLTIFPLAERQGAVVRIDDVTQRTQMEEVMVQTEKMLSVGGLAAGMAHEINNPLAGILQNTQVVIQRLAGDLKANQKAAEEIGLDLTEMRSYLERRGIFAMLQSIMDSGTRSARIVDNMLRFSRRSSSQKQYHSLADLMDLTVDLIANDYDLKKHYDFKRIRIIRHYQEPPPQVLCESSELQQVFLNILKNGAQAMTQTEGAQLTLRIETLGKQAQVMIEDNGPGMDEATRRRVFEPFFTTKEVGAGTGLGLSVAYFIVTESHGGTMTVESTPGGGTTFIIQLPGDSPRPH